MMKRLLPLAMLAGLAGVAGYCVGIVVKALDAIARVLLRIADPEPVKFEAELEQAKQDDARFAVEKPALMPHGTAQARDFVTMLRGIGSGSGEMAAA